MFCPNCGNNIRDDSNFCAKCGIPLKNQRARTRPGLLGAWSRSIIILKNYYRENKPGFFIVGLLLLIMFGSVGYYAYSVLAPGRFVVTLERITKEEKVDVYAQAALKVYCREFARECSEKGYEQIEKNIRLILPTILLPARTMDAKITYRNQASTPIQVVRFIERTVPGPWKAYDTQARYAPKLDRLRHVIQTAGGNVPFVTKVDFAHTLALTENHGSFIVPPGEQKTWRVGYTEKDEFQIEYVQNGKLYRTPVLRVR